MSQTSRKQSSQSSQSPQDFCGDFMDGLLGGLVPQENIPPEEVSQLQSSLSDSSDTGELQVKEIPQQEKQYPIFLLYSTKTTLEVRSFIEKLLSSQNEELLFFGTIINRSGIYTYKNVLIISENAFKYLSEKLGPLDNYVINRYKIMFNDFLSRDYSYEWNVNLPKIKMAPGIPLRLKNLLNEKLETFSKWGIVPSGSWTIKYIVPTDLTRKSFFTVSFSDKVTKKEISLVKVCCNCSYWGITEVMNDPIQCFWRTKKDYSYQDNMRCFLEPRILDPSQDPSQDQPRTFEDSIKVFIHDPLGENDPVSKKNKKRGKARKKTVKSVETVETIKEDIPKSFTSVNLYDFLEDDS